MNANDLRNLDLALTLMLQAASAVNSYGAVIGRARSEGRAPTDEEIQQALDQAAAGDDAARANLQRALDDARAKLAGGAS